MGMLIDAAEGVARQLDAMIPAAVRVDQPARDPGDIPQPAPPPPRLTAEMVDKRASGILGRLRRRWGGRRGSTIEE